MADALEIRDRVPVQLRLSVDGVGGECRQALGYPAESQASGYLGESEPRTAMEVRPCQRFHARDLGREVLKEVLLHLGV